MTDVVTKKRLVVNPGNEDVGPLLDLSADQLPAVRKLLDAHPFLYWHREYSISLGNGPFMNSISFGRKVDAAAVQAVLDAVP